MEYQPTNNEFFQHFVARKIDDGEKQKDIADSDPDQLNTSYISKIYRGKIKTIPIAKQRAIAKYFGEPLEDVLEKGKIIYYNENNRRHHKSLLRTTNNDLLNVSSNDLIGMLSRVAGGIEEDQKKLKEAEKILKDRDSLTVTIDILKRIIDKLDIGVMFFDCNNGFMFSNFKGGFLEGMNITENETFETMLLFASSKIKNFQELVNIIEKYNNKKECIDFTVQLKSKQRIEFSIHPIYSEVNCFLGTLLLNEKPSTE